MDEHEFDENGFDVLGYDRNGNYNRVKVVDLGSNAWFEYRDRLVAARDRTSTVDERSALFDDLAERFGHNSLAESLKDFGLA